MTRDDLRGRIQTVTGLIAPEDLGSTLMHEHILCDITPPRLAAVNTPDVDITLENYFDIVYGTVPHKGKYKLNMPEIITQEIAQVRAAGGKSVVEMTCGGLKPMPDGLAAMSRETGVQIIMGCGYYVHDYQPMDPVSAGVYDKTSDQVARDIIGQVFDGAWGTDVRAGIIGEIGCQAPWTDHEKKVMVGAVLAQIETGAAINVHPGRDPDQPLEAAEFIRAHDGDVSRVVISHIDRTIFDDERLLRLADSGVVVELDLFGQEMSYYPHSDIDMPNDAHRLRMIRTLIDHGHLERIVISHDICYCTRLMKFGGHGYGYIHRHILPLMLRRGFSQDEIDTIMERTPARILTFV